MFCFALAIASITTLAQAQTPVVLPGLLDSTVLPPDGPGGDPIDFSTQEGNSSGDGTALGNFTNTVLTVYNQSAVAAAGINPGDVLSGLAFRVGGGPDGFNPAPNFTVDNYIIELGQSLNSAGSLNETDFAANFAGGPTRVHSGSVDFNAADYEIGNINTGTGLANPFGPTIDFDTDFTYTGGDLLIRYTHSEVLSLTTGTSDGADIVTSRGDSIGRTFAQPDFQSNEVFTIFGEGFDANTRFTQAFGVSPGFATVLQFQVTSVPEPASAVLLMGLGMIGVARRRRKM